jgi:putative ABC transport system permease protein
VILLAIFLSAASLYALMSVAVTRRTREIGIRIAIGADPRAVLPALFARSATQIGAGIVIGNVLTALLLSLIVDEVRPSTVALPMLIASVVMALVGGAACFVPGRRALRIEPTEALKQAG